MKTRREAEKQVQNSREEGQPAEMGGQWEAQEV